MSPLLTLIDISHSSDTKANWQENFCESLIRYMCEWGGNISHKRVKSVLVSAVQKRIASVRVELQPYLQPTSLTIMAIKPVHDPFGSLLP